MFGRQTLSPVRKQDAPRRKRRALQFLEDLESRVVLSTVAVNSANTYIVTQTGVSNAFPKYVNLEGNATGPVTAPTKYAEYDIADFNFSGLVSNGQGVTGGTLTLTEADTSYSKSGPFDVYVVADQTALTRGATAPVSSPSTNDSISSGDFTTRYLIGQFTFPDTDGTTTPATPTTDTFNFTLTPSSAAAQLLLSEANSASHNVRLAFAPDNAATTPSAGNLTAATWFGSGATNQSGQNAPNLSLNITGNNTPPITVSSITPNATGFTAQFSAPIDPATVVLYNSKATLATTPVDVVVTDSGGNTIPGSAVVSTDGKSLSFIATQGVLPNGTYHVALTSGARGISGTNGQLAGNGATPGTNYSGNFTENVTGPVVTLPSFVAGPNQSVAAYGPTGTLDNLPLTLSDGTNTTGITATVTYDPTLLTITGVQKGVNAPAGSTVTITTQTLATNVATATITFTSPTPLAAGAAEFAQLVAQVPLNAAYAADQALTVSNVQTTVQTTGAHTGTTSLASSQTTVVTQTAATNHTFIDVEGNSTGNFAEYSVIDFNFAGQFGNVSSISTAVLGLTESNAAFTAPGTYDIYITGQTTTALTNVTYDTSTASGVSNSNFTDKVFVGSFNFTHTGTGGSGVVDMITFNGAGLTALKASLNNGGLVRLLATPDNAATPAVAATYGGQTSSSGTQKPTLAITATTSASSTTSAGMGGTSIGVTAYVGDTDADETYTGFDATLIKQVVGGTSTGFDAYPTVDPELIGDVDGDGSVTSFDATLVSRAVLNESGNGVPTIPNSAAIVTATDSSIIQTGGPRIPGTGTSNANTTFFNIEGSSSGAPSYAIADFNFSSTAVQGAKPTSIQFALTEDNASFTAGGTFDVYITGDTTTDITNDGSSPLFFDTSNTPEGINSAQFTDRKRIGTFTFAQGSQGQTDFYTATLDAASQALLASDLASGKVRLLFTPETATVAATFAGATPPSGFSAPSLQINT